MWRIRRVWSVLGPCVERCIRFGVYCTTTEEHTGRSFNRFDTATHRMHECAPFDRRLLRSVALYVTPTGLIIYAESENMTAHPVVCTFDPHTGRSESLDFTFESFASTIVIDRTRTIAGITRSGSALKSFTLSNEYFLPQKCECGACL